MEKEELFSKIKEAGKKEEFLEKAVNAKTAEELQTIFKDADIEISIEQAELTLKEIKAELNGEIDEEMLEDVNGGIGIAGACWLIAGGGAFLVGVYHGFTKK